MAKGGYSIVPPRELSVTSSVRRRSWENGSLKGRLHGDNRSFSLHLTSPETSPTKSPPKRFEADTIKRSPSEKKVPEKRSLLGKLFGMGKSKENKEPRGGSSSSSVGPGSPSRAAATSATYATFSAQFPPPDVNMDVLFERLHAQQELYQGRSLPPARRRRVADDGRAPGGGSPLSSPERAPPSVTLAEATVHPMFYSCYENAADKYHEHVGKEPSPTHAAAAAATAAAKSQRQPSVGKPSSRSAAKSRLHREPPSAAVAVAAADATTDDVGERRTPGVASSARPTTNRVARGDVTAMRADVSSTRAGVTSTRADVTATRADVTDARDHMDSTRDSGFESPKNLNRLGSSSAPGGKNDSQKENDAK
ncbi:PREDICTED: uncharacterized protein LOC106819792 [Priapulus caudatus]|uniref:Uncharacterized protein LOC106819792 n=1 Tax=Priapulus caudatus TaxID=37621 RepID=A0ABM1F5Z2_PRICU|nr:PREDICTED: uncharacterized protein LOC106819792 [Priapulus caudatus]